MRPDRQLVHQLRASLPEATRAHLDAAIDKIVAAKKKNASVVVVTGSGPNIHEGVTTLIAELIRKGILKAESPVEIMIANAALSQGLITLYRAGRIVGGEAEFRELYLRTTERGMASFFVEKIK